MKTPRLIDRDIVIYYVSKKTPHNDTNSQLPYTTPPSQDRWQQISGSVELEICQNFIQIDHKDIDSEPDS